MASLGNTIERITEYVQVKAEQLRLKVIVGVSRLLANVLAFSFIVVAGLFFVFFLSFGVGAYLNELLESSFWGHLIIAGFYFLIIILILILIKTNSLQRWLEELIIKLADQKDEQEDQTKDESTG